MNEFGDYDRRRIEKSIRQLGGSLGYRKPVDETKLRTLYAAKDHEGFILEIRNLLKAECRLRIGFVNSGGPQNAPAWITLPNNPPLLGSSEWKKVPVTVYIRKSFLAEASCDLAMRAVSHEFCHVILEAVRHPLKDNEEATDLAAMVLGFRQPFTRSQEETKKGLEKFEAEGKKLFEKLRRGTIEMLGGVVRTDVYQYGYLCPDAALHAGAYIEEQLRKSGSNH